MRELVTSTNKRQFYRQTFQVKDKGVSKYRHTMLVNPQDMSVSEPARISTQQTLGGAYVSNFGQGLFQVSLSGITGYSARYNAEGVLRDGYSEFRAFRDKIYRDFVTTKSTQLELFWYNWEDEEYYKVVPLTFRLMRSRSEAILYRYEITFVCLNPVGVKSKPKTPAQQNLIDKLTPGLIGTSIGDSISGTSEVLNTLKGMA